MRILASRTLSRSILAGIAALTMALPAVVWAAHSGSAPIDPPNPSNNVFVIDSGGGLDTGCTFRNGSPLRIQIPVDSLPSVLPATAKLLMPAFDVDDKANVPGYQPEVDIVSFNGLNLGHLLGINNAWTLNSFYVPIAKVVFPTGGSGAVSNDVTIEIDTANAEFVWCTAIDWAALILEEVTTSHGMSLIGIDEHGVDTNSNGKYEHLDVSFLVNLEDPAAGTYRWSAAIEAPDGTNLGMATGSGFFSAGARTLPLRFDGTAIGSSGLDGPYKVTNFIAWRSGGNAPNMISTLAGETAAYQACDFEGCVVDTTPPVITATSASPDALWPPDDTMKDVSITVTATDDFTANPTCEVTSVTSNEGDSGDLAVTGPLSVRLRAARSGNGSGRVYTVTVTCTDDTGNRATANVGVVVPHDQGKKQ